MQIGILIKNLPLSGGVRAEVFGDEVLVGTGPLRALAHQLAAAGLDPLTAPSGSPPKIDLVYRTWANLLFSSLTAVTFGRCIRAIG